MQSEVIQRAQENGHFEVKKNLEALQQQYYFENMKKKEEAYIVNYITCILGARKQGRGDGMLNNRSCGSAIIAEEKIQALIGDR